MLIRVRNKIINMDNVTQVDLAPNDRTAVWFEFVMGGGASFEGQEAEYIREFLRSQYRDLVPAQKLKG
jgi:hypothetical protein